MAASLAWRLVLNQPKTWCSLKLTAIIHGTYVSVAPIELPEFGDTSAGHLPQHYVRQFRDMSRRQGTRVEKCFKKHFTLSAIDAKPCSCHLPGMQAVLLLPAN